MGNSMKMNVEPINLSNEVKKCSIWKNVNQHNSNHANSANSSKKHKHYHHRKHHHHRGGSSKSKDGHNMPHISEEEGRATTSGSGSPDIQVTGIDVDENTPLTSTIDGSLLADNAEDGKPKIRFQLGGSPCSSIGSSEHQVVDDNNAV
jgi:hypothetical protein